MLTALDKKNYAGGVRKIGLMAMPVSWSQIVIHQVFQCRKFKKNACAASVLRKLGPDVTFVTNAISEQIKPGLRLRAHARYAFSRNWDRPNLGPPRTPVVNYET